jgi:hypothetical protein
MGTSLEDFYIPDPLCLMSIESLGLLGILQDAFGSISFFIKYWSALLASYYKNNLRIRQIFKIKL